MQRKTFFKFTAAALLGAAVFGASAQQAWPTKQPIRIIVPTPAGAAPDLTARIIGDKLSRALGQAVVIENKPGAGGIVAMNLLKASPNDGYTIALAQAAVVVVTPFTYKEATYDVERDFETFAMAGKTPMLFVTNATNPAKNMADAVAMARARPGEVAVGNPTRTSIPHLASELVGIKTNVKFQQVSFANTGQGVQAVVNGDIAFYADGAGPLIQLVKSGRLRALGIAAETELPGMEGIPLVNKTIPGLNVYGWFSMHAPKGTPVAIMQRLNTEINNAMAQPDVVTKFNEFGTYATPGTMADAQRFVKSEVAQFGGVIRTLGLKPE